MRNTIVFASVCVLAVAAAGIAFWFDRNTAVPPLRQAIIRNLTAESA